MALFSRRSEPSTRPDADAGRLTLEQTWQLFTERAGWELVEHEPRAIHARGTIRGRRVDARVRGSGSGMAAFMQEFRPPQRRREPRDQWQCALAVECTNPRGLTGTVLSVVDVRDPAWDPRNFDPAHCRVVQAEPRSLADAALTAQVRERLMAVTGDVSIEVSPTFVRLTGEGSSPVGGSFLAGCVIHHYPGPVQPWPERGLAGPRWWVDTLCDLADALDAVS